MARSHSVALAVVAMVGPFIIGACGSSSTSSSNGSDTIPYGAVTAPAAAPVDNKTPGSSVDATLGDTKGLDGPMTITVAAATVKAGDVTFNVKNAGTIDHEMLVFKTDTAFDQLPIVDSGDPPAPVTSGADKVDEAPSVGETGDPNLKAGETRTFTLNGLTPGKYVLICNLAKHYGLGMRTALTVVG